MRKIAFIHVPRTGGTSLKSALREVYPQPVSWFAEFPFPPNINDFDCLAGHMTYGQVQNFVDACVVTILRHPVDLELSHLNRLYGLREQRHPLSHQFRAMVRTAEHSLDEFIDLWLPVFPWSKIFVRDLVEPNSAEAKRVLCGLTLVGFYSEMEQFYDQLAKLIGTPLQRRHENASPPHFTFSREQRARAAWKLRDDVALYHYAWECCQRTPCPEWNI